jgi:hypothetical protein
MKVHDFLRCKGAAKPYQPNLTEPSLPTKAVWYPFGSFTAALRSLNSTMDLGVGKLTRDQILALAE